MTKWARMRKRKKRERAEEMLKSSEAEGEEAKLTEPEKISEITKHPQEMEESKLHTSFEPKSILAQIPRYVYLLAIFALLSGVFFPLVSLSVFADIVSASLNFVIGGTITLFLGVSGCILLFKGITSDNKRGIFLVAGFALIAISLALIFQIQDWWKAEFYK